MVWLHIYYFPYNSSLIQILEKSRYNLSIVLKDITIIVNKLNKEIYHSKDLYYRTHEIQEIVKFQDEF